MASVLVGVCVIFASSFVVAFAGMSRSSFADNEESKMSNEPHFVTIYDGESKLSVKTSAVLVSEVLERANIVVGEYDTVDPGLDAIIDSDNYKINIYRARPVVVVDGLTRKYIMSASYDPKTVVMAAGVTVYDGDEIETIEENDFLANGENTTYKVTRNGGRMVTVEEPIAFVEEVVKDPELEQGQTRVTQVGEDGLKVIKYEVNFVDNVEVSRNLVSEEVVKEPVKKIIAEGTKGAALAVPTVAPGQETCAQWAREAGVSEADLAAALFLIYHESGCRVNATNASSGAYGIPQALPGGKMASAGADWQTNPVTQIRWMAGYVGRYGGWQGAYNFWNSHHWY